MNIWCSFFPQRIVLTSLYLEIYNMYAWGYICSYMNKISQIKFFFRGKI